MADPMRLLAITFLAVSASAFAQSADPTRPPANWLAPVEATGLAADASAGGGLRLQSVLMPQGGKPVAIIAGKTVPLGGRIGDARLVRLNEVEAVLQGADGVTHLYMSPDVKKQMIVTPNRRNAGKTGQLKGLP